MERAAESKNTKDVKNLFQNTNDYGLKIFISVSYLDFE